MPFVATSFLLPAVHAYRLGLDERAWPLALRKGRQMPQEFSQMARMWIAGWVTAAFMFGIAKRGGGNAIMMQAIACQGVRLDGASEDMKTLRISNFPIAEVEDFAIGS